jgi:hypothetical protein
VDDECWVQCPFCHEEQLLVVDPQTVGSFVQDCDVCCRPWQVYVARNEDGELDVMIERSG